MSLAVITVSNLSPALDKKSSEVSVIAQALHIAATSIQGAQGTQTSGNIVGNGGVVLGTWAYTSQGSLP
jgi:hypothetical protein